MSIGLGGCNPLITWENADDAPAVGSLGFNHGGIYVLGRARGTSIVAGSCVGIDKGAGGFGFSPAAKGYWDAKHAIAVMQVALPSGDYGWGLVFGYGNVRVTGNAAAATRLYTTSTAGTLGTSSSSQTAIPSITLTAARGSGTGLAPCVINKLFPRVR